MSTLTIQPSTVDVSGLVQQDPDTNYGTNNTLWISSSTINLQRPLIRFDFSSLPDDAVISQAVLGLYYEDIFFSNPVGRTYWVYELTQTGWTELGATFNKYDGSNSWVTPGGDYTTTNGASAVVPASFGWMTWDITELVKHFQTSHGKIANLLLRDGVETNNEYGAYVGYSREYTGDTSLRPKLVITYTVTPTLVVQDGSQGQAVGNVVVTQVHNLAVASGSQSQAVGNVVLTQVHILTLADGLQGQAVGNVVITQTHELAVAGGVQAQDVGNVALTQAHILTVASGLQSQAVDNLDIVLAILLAVASGVQGQAVNNVILTQAHNLAVAGGVQAQAVDNAILTQAHNLAVAGGSQGQLVDTITITMIATTLGPIKILLVSGNVIIPFY
jgi:hypothetical protein